MDRRASPAPLICQRPYIVLTVWTHTEHSLLDMLFTESDPAWLRCFLVGMFLRSQPSPVRDVDAVYRLEDDRRLQRFFQADKVGSGARAWMVYGYRDAGIA
jgi:hypothetical protein